MYLNDLEEYLYVNNVRGLTCLNKIRKDLNLLYLSLFVLLYAVFFKNNSFNLNFNDLYYKAIKAMYSCIGKCRKHNLAIDCKLDMLDKIVQPIFLYGCEVWGFQKTKFIEKLHLKFCKHLLNLSSSTPNYMVYGELGRYPLIINIKVRMISFWGKLINSQNSKLSSKLFSCTQKL